jgi:hypothetical protein
MMPETLLSSKLLTSGMIRLAVRKKYNEVLQKPPDSIINADVKVVPLPDHKIT